MGTLNVGRVNASTLDAAAALNFPSYTTGNRPSSGIDTGATIYNSTDEKLQTWNGEEWMDCLLYTSPSPRDKRQSRMPSSA